MSNFSVICARILTAFSAAALVCVSPVLAQSTANTQLMSNGLIEEFSAADVESMLGELDISLVRQPYAGDNTVSMLATTSGGATFVITALSCSDPAAALGCKQAVVYTGISNAGVVFDDINTFHTNANVTRAINVPQQDIIVFGTQIFSQGGIGRQNFQLLTALFLRDMQDYIQNQRAAGTSVSLQLEMAPKNKIGNRPTISTESIMLPSFYRENISHTLTAAVSNTRNVDFLGEKAAELVE